ncbi:MAG: DUF4325 domain-containing protein [Pseudomonadota bacterium]|nr:DUF4325 domain-containing protein [Pseudomonadota bacterium]
MSKLRARGEKIRLFILENVEAHPRDIGKIASEHFNISRQAINVHLKYLTAKHSLIQTGKTRNCSYKPSPLLQWDNIYPVTPDLAEDIIWRNDILPRLNPMPDNVLKIWDYGFTEMFNNAIDHSDCTEIHVYIKKTPANTEICISDNGVGIFKKIKDTFNLLDEKWAIFELAKGKLTTDPFHHTGEGIFFSSRMFDEYSIISRGISFAHNFGDREDWIIEGNKHRNGTSVWMLLNNHTARTTKKIFDQYTVGDDDYGFNKTVVPVKLAQYGNDELISRSQAKRLLARVELFQIVLLDFEGVTSIGQSFADEIFRVFVNEHPNISLFPINANDRVKQMISRAESVKLS